jgi:hypothetical protein
MITGHSTSYELGFTKGASDAKNEGIKETDEIEALGIASWQVAKRSMELELVEFCTGYTEGYAAYLSGIV